MKTNNQNRRGRRCFLYPAALIVKHGPHSSKHASCNKGVLNFKSSFLDNNSTYRALTFIKL